MTKQNLITIAQAAFPNRVKQFINWDNLEILTKGNIHWLYDKDTPFMAFLPHAKWLVIQIVSNNDVFIDVGIKAFNHLAAIDTMRELGLISKQ